MRKHYAVTAFALVAVLAALATPAFGLFRTGGGTGMPPRECMSRALWSALGGERPCIRIASLYEDGSARIVQESFDNRRRVVCVLQNPGEVRHAYLARCIRTR